MTRSVHGQASRVRAAVIQQHHPQKKLLGRLLDAAACCAVAHQNASEARQFVTRVATGCCVWFGRAFSTRRISRVILLALREVALQVALKVSRYRRPHTRHWYISVSRPADSLTGQPIRGRLIQSPLGQRIDDFVVDRVVCGEPLLVRDQVAFVRQVVCLIDDERTAVASDLHDPFLPCRFADCSNSRLLIFLTQSRSGFHSGTIASAAQCTATLKSPP